MKINRVKLENRSSKINEEEPKNNECSNYKVYAIKVNVVICREGE